MQAECDQAHSYEGQVMEWLAVILALILVFLIAGYLW